MERFSSAALIPIWRVAGVLSVVASDPSSVVLCPTERLLIEVIDWVFNASIDERRSPLNTKFLGCLNTWLLGSERRIGIGHQKSADAGILICSTDYHLACGKGTERSC